MQKTLWGNLILGPTARDQHEWPNPDVDPDYKDDILGKILPACRKLVPSFDVNDAFHSFAGARAKSSRGDWIIERCATEEDMIHVAGIDSPGIAGSPAIALEAVELLKEAGLELTPDPTFNPKRAPVIFPKDGEEGLVFTPDTKTEVNAAGVSPRENVVCKCEKVTEEEIIEACRRSLPVDSIQCMRKRTRAGMGGCQGKPWNYGCECRVAQARALAARPAQKSPPGLSNVPRGAQIIARENELPTPMVGRRPWSATSQFPRRWLTDDDKAKLTELSNSAPPS